MRERGISPDILDYSAGVLKRIFEQEDRIILADSIGFADPYSTFVLLIRARAASDLLIDRLAQLAMADGPAVLLASKVVSEFSESKTLSDETRRSFLESCGLIDRLGRDRF